MRELIVPQLISAVNDKIEDGVEVEIVSLGKDEHVDVMVYVDVSKM